MQELSKSLERVSEGHTLDYKEHLRETAKKWAGYVLEHNKDEELKLGLEISHAICNYLNELEEGKE